MIAGRLQLKDDLFHEFMIDRLAFLKWLQKRLMMASELTPCMPKYWQFPFAFLKRLQKIVVCELKDDLFPELMIDRLAFLKWLQKIVVCEGDDDEPVDCPVRRVGRHDVRGVPLEED